MCAADTEADPRPPNAQASSRSKDLAGLSLAVGILIQILLVVTLARCVPSPPTTPTEGADSARQVAFQSTARSMYYLMLVVTFLVSVAPALVVRSLILCPMGGVQSLCLNARLLLASKRGILIVVACVLIVPTGWAIATRIRHEDPSIVPYFIATAAAIIICSLILWLRPAGILILTGSRRDAGMLLELVAKRSMPHRAVALVEERATGPKMFFVAQVDNLRTAGGARWQSVVRQLIRQVNVVVADARVATPHVTEEISWLLEPDIASKSLLVTTPDHTAPALEPYYSVAEKLPFLYATPAGVEDGMGKRLDRCTRRGLEFILPGLAILAAALGGALTALSSPATLDPSSHLTWLYLWCPAIGIYGASILRQRSRIWALAFFLLAIAAIAIPATVIRPIR